MSRFAGRRQPVLADPIHPAYVELLAEFHGNLLRDDSGIWNASQELSHGCDAAVIDPAGNDGRKGFQIDGDVQGEAVAGDAMRDADSD